MGFSYAPVQAKVSLPVSELPPRPTRYIVNPGDLALDIRASQSQVSVGDEILFTITLRSIEPIKGHGLNVLGLIPSVLDVLKVSTTHGLIGYNSGTHLVKAYYVSPIQTNATVTITILTRVSNRAESGEMYYAAAKAEYYDPLKPFGLFSNWSRIMVE